MESDNRALDGRDSTGRFVAGNPGNPKGRPRQFNVIKELAQQHSEEAFKVIISLMHSADKDQTKFAAAQEVLNRAIGKPHQAVQLEGHVAHYVARLPAVQKETALWMEQQANQRLSGSLNLDHKPTS